MSIMRVQTLYLINIQLKDKIKDPRDLMLFSWEEAPKIDVDILNVEGWEELDKKFLRGAE